MCKPLAVEELAKICQGKVLDQLNELLKAFIGHTCSVLHRKHNCSNTISRHDILIQYLNAVSQYNITQHPAIANLDLQIFPSAITFCQLRCDTCYFQKKPTSRLFQFHLRRATVRHKLQNTNVTLTRVAIHPFICLAGAVNMSWPRDARRGHGRNFRPFVPPSLRVLVSPETGHDARFKLGRHTRASRRRCSFSPTPTRSFRT